MLAEVGETYSPKGATAIVMDPRNSQILAMANWPPVDPSDLSERQQRGPAQPGDRLHLRAGLDLQGVHGRRGAARKNWSRRPPTFTLPPTHPGRRPHDRGVARARHRDDERRRHPRPLLERRRGDDRAGARRRKIQQAGSTASASAARPGSSSRPRSRGSCPPLDEYSGSTMGNLPIGQGLSVTPMQMMAGYAAIANGGILRAAAADRADRRRRGRTSRRASG